MGEGSESLFSAHLTLRLSHRNSAIPARGGLTGRLEELEERPPVPSVIQTFLRVTQHSTSMSFGCTIVSPYHFLTSSMHTCSVKIGHISEFICDVQFGHVLR